MGKSSSIGRNHVLQVSAALTELLTGQSASTYPDTIVQTVNFIHKKYPNIKYVQNKYEAVNPDDQPSLKLTLEDGNEVRVNLFTIRGNAQIQPKNLGAKSFLKKYFHSKGLQLYFNDYLNKEYKIFLTEIVAKHEKVNTYDTVATLKKKVAIYYPKFNNKINILRRVFLFNLREYCFKLLTDEYNLGATGIQNAFNELMLLNDTTIITRYSGENKCLSVGVWKSNINSKDGVNIYKKGNDTVGIRSGDEALTLRFKFESRPTSSIKIATSYEVFPESNRIIQDNLQSIQKFEGLLNNHSQDMDKTGRENAIGKCNEAIIYYRIVKENLSVNQINAIQYTNMLENYYSKLSSDELESLNGASTVTTRKLYSYLNEKYEDYKIQDIQLTGENYLKNRLDTSDLQLVLLVDQKYIIESFSLKAIAKRNTNITAKNPGVGQILGPTYFDIGSLVLTIEEAETKFKRNDFNHREAQEFVSKKIGEELVKAPQENIQKGLKALLGDKTTVITIYLEQDSLVLEYDAIKDTVVVQPETPTPIQTTLLWNNGQEELSLRVKFSRGQRYGWSALKLSCDYRIRY